MHLLRDYRKVFNGYKTGERERERESVTGSVIYHPFITYRCLKLILKLCGSLMLSSTVLLFIQVSETVDFEVLRGLTNALLAAKKPDEVCNQTSG